MTAVDKAPLIIRTGCGLSGESFHDGANEAEGHMAPVDKNCLANNCGRRTTVTEYMKHCSLSEMSADSKVSITTLWSATCLCS